MSASPQPLGLLGPRLLQQVSCAHIYSALAQTDCKINLAKFTHGKCSTLIMTDGVALGLDILLLDNVINFSFPAKDKLFLHHACAVNMDGVLSQVPQSMVDEEDCGLRNTLEVSLELRGLGCKADNAQQQYMRLWLTPSPESIKWAKDLDLTGLGLHLLFSSSF
ncbi:ATP-dependent RNA helicase DDX54 [Myotis davidii]|uniref:ATP-dependent RNA helicase DDX54 n=1 Tax=Myotis davidii TaxID=225400 RepID=L5MFX9_MYODS|nr:ATP-dependent RNA helicase DDX54 [Myotis davidii]